MSSIQNKLVNLELAPPAGVWEKIADELDDAAFGFQFPSKLQALSVSPPPAVWNKITEGLDAELVSEDISSKLYAAEVMPPAAAWKKIQTSLDIEEGAAVPEHRRLSPLLRYAAAAVVIGLIAFGALQLLTPGKGNTETVSATELSKTEVTVPVPAPPVSNIAEKEDITDVISAGDEEARNDAALEASKKTYARLEIPVQKRTDIAAAFNFAHLANSDDIDEPGSASYEEGLASDNTDKTDRYIVLMTPDGHFIRMSKKLSNLVCCVSGEEEDANCKNQVQKWRKQLACSDAAHPGNFMDILSLVGSLQDN